MRSKAAHLGNGLIIAGILAFLFAPQGAVQRWRLHQQATAERSMLIGVLWDSIAGGSVVRPNSAEPRRLLVEFGHYRCPYCRAAHETIMALLEKYPTIQYEYRHYASASDTVGQLAARASMCADSLGYFRKMHEHLLNVEVWVDDMDWLDEAARAGVPDTGDLGDCIHRQGAIEGLRKDVRVGTALSLNGTPAWVWEGGLQVGAADLKAVVRAAAGFDGR